MIAVYCVGRTEYRNKFCGQDGKWTVLEQVSRTVATELWRLKPDHSTLLTQPHPLSKSCTSRWGNIGNKQNQSAKSAWGRTRKL